MNLTKKMTSWFLALVMALGLISQTVFAQEPLASSLQYEVTQEINESKTEATILIQFIEDGAIQLRKVTLPNSTEQIENLSNITYVVSENGNYDFKVNYSLNGTEQEETIPVLVSGLDENKAGGGMENPSQNGINYVHLNFHHGDDGNDGLTEDTSVQTFEKAKSLIKDGDVILLDSYYEINGNEEWELTEYPNSKIQRNTGMDMIVVNPMATLTLKNIVIDGSHYQNIDQDPHSIIKLGKLAGSQNDGSNLVLKSGAILENNQNNRSIGGAVGGFSYDKITMESGSIIRNNGTIDQTAQFGGGIHLENHGQFIMNGGIIENNHAVRGGGVCLIASSMIMNGGEIINNSANSKDAYAGHYGGGIYVSNFQDWPAVGGDYSREIAGEASFTMNDGVISGNEATFKGDNRDFGLGGAIATYPAFYAGYEKNPAITITINQGDIVGNAAINGGAISAYFKATNVNISNANISGNTALSQGGAIYDVFNASVDITNTVISQNTAELGAGAYLYASKLNMYSGEISQNEASGYGGGIFINSSSHNGETAVCTILGGSIYGNTAQLGKGSDGIYQNSTLNIGDHALIDQDNDVYLPSGRIIDVITPLQSITRQNCVSITSEDCVIEDEQNAGTPLVHYHSDAGGVDAAQNAEEEQLYIPSTYMQEGLVIGKSHANGQLDYMTYVQKETYPVIYKFISGTDGKTLPQEVMDYLPIDRNRYLEGTMINAIQPVITEVEVANGTWKFEQYDAISKIASQDNLNADGFIQFEGTWAFEKSGNPGPSNPDRPTDPDPDKPVDPNKPIDPNKPTDPNKPIDPNKPVDLNQPGNPHNPSNPTQPGNPGSNKPGKPNQNKPPQSGSVGTATRTNLLFSSILLLISGVCALFAVCLRLHKFNDEIQ